MIKGTVFLHEQHDVLDGSLKEASEIVEKISMILGGMSFSFIRERSSLTKESVA